MLSSSVGEDLFPVTEVRIQGVLQNTFLSLDALVWAVSRSAFALLTLVCQLHPFLQKSDLAMATPALVITQLDDCNGLNVGLPLECLQSLQRASKMLQPLLITGSA